MNKWTFFMVLFCSSVSATDAGEQVISNPANLTGKYYTNPVIHADYSDPDRKSVV